MASSLGSPVGGGGSALYTPSGIELIFTALKLEAQLQANALVAPADTPTEDEVRHIRDASGKRAIWAYSVSAAAWAGVELLA